MYNLRDLVPRMHAAVPLRLRKVGRKLPCTELSSGSGRRGSGSGNKRCTSVRIAPVRDSTACSACLRLLRLRAELLDLAVRELVPGHRRHDRLQLHEQVRQRARRAPPAQRKAALALDHIERYMHVASEPQEKRPL